MARFGYALGRVLVLEGRLMSAARLDRLAHAADLAEQKHVLAETEYAGLLDHAESREEIERSIFRRVQTALELLDESRAGPVADFFRLPHDWLNAKIALRRESGEPGLTFSDLGRLGVESWETGELPDWIAEPLEDARALAQKEGVVAAMRELEGRGLAARSAAAKELRDPLALELAHLDVDAANVRLLARGAPPEDLFGGGRADRARLAQAFAAEGLGAAAGLVVEGLAPGLHAEGPGSGTAGPITPDRFEVLVARTELFLARKGRLATATSEPVVAWMTSVEAEARLVRLIVLGRMDGIPAEAVRERVAAIHG